MASTGKVRARLAAAVESVLKGIVRPRGGHGAHGSGAFDVEPLERRVMLTSSPPAWLAPGSAASWDPGTHGLTVTGPATIIADPGADEPLVTVSGPNAALTIEPATDTWVHLGGLTLTDGGSAEVTRPDAAAFDQTASLVVELGVPGESNPSALSIDSTGHSTLGIEDNDLIVRGGTDSVPAYIWHVAVQASGLPPAGVTLNPDDYRQDGLAVPDATAPDAQPPTRWDVAGRSLSLAPGDALVKYVPAGEVPDWSNPGGTSSVSPAAPVAARQQIGPRYVAAMFDQPALASGPTPAYVSSVVVNGNNAALIGPQRSMVDGLLYTFSEPVTLDPTTAFRITVQSGQTGTLPTLGWAPVNPDANGAATQWAVTFSGSGVLTGSIANGVYAITLRPNAVISEANPTVPAQPHNTDVFFRLFGDGTGDGRVDASDNTLFQAAQVTYNPAFDYNGDGTVNAADNLQFKRDQAISFTGQISFNPAALRPTNLAATITDATSVTLSWTPPSDPNVTGYTVDRWSSGDPVWAPIAQHWTGSTYPDALVQPNTDYEYRLAAEESGGLTSDLSQPSNDALMPPPMPSNVTATAEAATVVDLTWTAADATVTAYHVERSTDGGTTFTEIASDVQGTEFLDKSAAANTTYTYRVRAENNGAYSNYATSASVTTPAATPPAMPAGLAAVPYDAGIALTWTANTEPDLLGYNVYRAPSPSGPFTTALNGDTPLTTPAFNDPTAPAGVTSYYQVTAVNASNQASAPATASATRPAGTAVATPTNLAAAVLNAEGVLLTWSALQGLTYSVYRDGQMLATGLAAAAYLDSPAQGGVAHNYTVSATDSSGNTSPQSAPVTATPPGTGSAYDAQAPGAPSVQVSPPPQNPDSSIHLSWSASSDQGGSGLNGYAIFRDGVQVGATAAVAFTDTGLDADTPYTYVVVASDNNGNQTASVPVTTSTATDQTKPQTPLDPQVTSIVPGHAANTYDVSLSWVQPWDNVGVSGYQVTWYATTGPYSGTASSLTTSSTISSLPANNSFAFQITAQDAAGNVSSTAATASATTPGGPATDDAPSQYIPQPWQDYFYNTLTAALRQKITQLPEGGPFDLQVPQAAGWLDLPGPSSSQSPFQSPFESTFLANAPQQANAAFHDLNGNGLLDPGESAWIPAQFGVDTFQPGDTVVAGPTPPTGATATGREVWYVGPTTNGVFDPSKDTLLPNPWMIHGKTGLYDYYDQSGTGTWQYGDPVWLASTPNVYSSGDTVIYNPYNVALTPGTYGKTNGINYYDVDGNVSNRIVWVDQTTFRQDFAAFYPAMDALIPNFASGQSYPNDIYTAGTLLAQIGATPVAGAGTVSIQTTDATPYGTTVTGAGTAFTTEFVTGDNIQINGNWYPIASVDSDTQLTLSSAYSGPSVNGAAFDWINWTKVPNTTDPGTGLSFSFTRGEPDTNSLIFPQQFQQLDDAFSHLNSYPQRFGQWLFDSSTSQQFIAAATQAISMSDSLFGNSPNNPDPALKLDIESGDADPGSIYTLQILYDLQDAVYEPRGTSAVTSVYVRGNGLNGWAQDALGYAITFADPSELDALLPALATPLSNRYAGSWSGPPDPSYPGRQPIAPVDISEIQGVLTAVQNNGLWIANGGPAYNRTLDYSKFAEYYIGDFPSDYVPPSSSWPLLSDWPAYPPDQIPQAQGDVAVLQLYTAPAPGATGGKIEIAGVKETATLPSSTNPLGGTALTTLAVGTDPIDIDVSGWTWGSTPTIVSYTPDQIFGDLASQYESGPPPLQPGDAWIHDVGVRTSLAHVTVEIYDEAWYGSGGDVERYYEFDLYCAPKGPNKLYGLVPQGTFTYSPTHSAPQPTTIAPPPDVQSNPLPLTTAMDYLNVMPDNGTIDGIVHTAADLTAFGNDTGVITFTAQNGMAQTLLPINADTTGTLPVNTYLTQGAFGTADGSVGGLLSQDIAGTSINQDGLPWAYNLNTHVRINLLVNDANNHIKRIEVIRPGGNAVVFDFAWDPALGMFDPIGTPDGWSGRDANQTYILRALNPDNDASMNYELVFADGVVHKFQTYNLPVPFGAPPVPAIGTLVSVADASAGLTESVAGGVANSSGTFSLPASFSEPRYNVMPNWQAGNLASIDYQTQDQNHTRTVQTVISYGGVGANDVSGLTKNDGDGGTRITQFSDSASGNTITRNGVTVSRSGSVSGGSVTITTSLPADPSFAAGSSTTEVYTFNDHGLVTSDAVTLDEGNGQSSTATTEYQYQTDVGAYASGIPSWSKVVKVTMPDGTWVGYQYDTGTKTNTGWLTQTITPFESSTWNPPEAPGDSNDTSADRMEQYGYDPKQSGNGQAPDTSLPVQPPRTVTGFVQGVQTAETFDDYGAPASDGSASPTILTRQALSDSNPTWANAGLFSTTTINAFDATSTMSVTGNLSNQKSGNGYSGIINDTVTNFWFNDVPSEILSQSSQATDAFGDATSSTDEALGQAYQSDTSSRQDPFGRPLAQSLASGASVTDNYTNSNGATSWFGPASVIEADQSTTKYTYTPLGQVATKTVFAGTDYSIQYSYVYDAAGNVVSQTTQAVDAGGNPISSDPTGDPTSQTNAYAYDAQNRLTKEVDNANAVGSDPTANQTTTYLYGFDGTYNITSIAYADGSTQVTKTYLDGTTASVGGSATTPATYAEGVVAQDTPDANQKIETAGSTWVLASSDEGKSWTRTYTNVIGEQYLVQTSDPSSSAVPGQSKAYGDAVTVFDGNLQPVEQVGADGTKSFTAYDPLLGEPLTTWTDVAGTGSFVQGVDPRTVTHANVSADPSQPAADNTTQLSTDGSQSDNRQVLFGGLNTSQTVDGMTTSTLQTLPPDQNHPGDYTVTTTNPDHTKDVQTYTDGLLTQDQQRGVAPPGGTAPVVATTTYGYDALRRMTRQTDNTGEADFRYYGDGTQKSGTDPHPAGSGAANTTTDATPDPKASQPQTTTRADGSTQTQTFDTQGNLASQAGAGLLAAGYGYDTAGTGNLASLTTYGSTTATTTWNYDPNTGQLQDVQYADLTKDAYGYNGLGQLANETLPGAVAGTFGYDAAADPIRSTYIDPVSGLVQSVVAQQDDLGRPVVTLDTDNGRTFTTTDAYTPQGDLKTETFGSAGNAAVGYAYYPLSPGVHDPNPQAESPDALQSLTIGTPAGQSAQQGYAYEPGNQPGNKRLQTITVNGITITYAYLNDSNQLQSITAGNVTTLFTPDSSDGALLHAMSVTAGGQTVYSAQYGYNPLDQRSNDAVTTTAVDDAGNTSSVDASRTYTYDPNQADALVKVQDGSGATIEAYGFDGAGNLVDANGDVRAPNNVNQLSGYAFNARGDATGTANYTLQWDALDRPVEIAPKTPVLGSYEIQLGYDSQNRWLWKDAYAYDPATRQWDQYAYSRKAVWSGGQLVAELDQNGNFVKQYTWGPNGLALITDYSSGSPRSYVPIADASGNTAMVVDALTGAVVASYTYDAFGNVLSASGPMKDLCPFLGKGLYLHAEVPGLMFAQNRVTDGRSWLSRDPSGESGGLNLYQLYAGDPINESDPTGLSVSKEQTADALSNAKDKLRATYAALAEFGQMAANGASGDQLASQADLINRAQDEYQTALRRAFYYGGSYAGAQWFLWPEEAAGLQQIAALPSTISGVKPTEGQATALTDAINAFAKGTGTLVSHANTLLTTARATKDVCDAVAIAGGITSLAEVAAEQGIAIACERLAEVAATTAATALADQVLVDPICAKLGIDPTWVRIGIAAYQCFSLYKGVCFPAGTLVATEHGPAPIETIEPGTKVWSYDAETQKWRLCEVLRRLERRYDGEMVTITVGDEEISATAGHPFWVTNVVPSSPSHGVTTHGDAVDCVGGGGFWVKAADLRVGDNVLQLSRKSTPIRRVAYARSKLDVFNLSVDELHCFVVGLSGTLVHNMCPGAANEELPPGLSDRGSKLGTAQGREFRTEQLETYEFDENQASHVRGWLANERRRMELGQADAPRNPPGYVQAHGRATPAREGFDYSNSRLQGEDLNKLEEAIRRARQ